MGKWQRFKSDTRVTLKKTLRLAVDANAIDSAESMASLRHAAELLRSGGTVAFPTETVYGLGANALDEAAVQAVFDAKQRPAWDPLIVHIASEEQLRLVAGEIPPNGRLLMEAFWPGPLTLLLPKSLRVPAIVTASRPRIGVRMPGHPVARRLIEFAGVPVAAPSANSFGRTSPTRADFVLEDLDGRIDAVIDSGDSSLGLESTVVDVCEEPPILYRPGMVTFQQVQAVCQNAARLSRAAGRRIRAKCATLPWPGPEALLPSGTINSPGGRRRREGKGTEAGGTAGSRWGGGWHHAAERSNLRRFLAAVPDLSLG